jgi:hypothetical protein
LIPPALGPLKDAFLPQGQGIKDGLNLVHPTLIPERSAKLMGRWLSFVENSQYKPLKKKIDWKTQEIIIPYKVFLIPL